MHHITESLPRFSEAEYRRRYEKIRTMMRERGLDCLVIYGAYRDIFQSNAHYVSGLIDTFHYYVIMPAEGELTLINQLFPAIHEVKKITPIEDVRWGGAKIAESVVKRLRELRLETSNIGIVGVTTWWTVTLPADHLQVFEQELPQAAFSFHTDLIESCRLIKSEEEIAFAQRGAELTDLAMDALCKAIRPGMREYELYGAVMQAALAAGGRPDLVLIGSTPMQSPSMAFPTLMYRKASNRYLRMGDLVTSELSISYGDYSGQAIRCFTLGEPRPEYRALHEVALKAYHAVAAALKPGNTENDVMAAAQIIPDSGFQVGAPVVHGWGNKPEEPLIGVKGSKEWIANPVKFEPGMFLMVEPNPCTDDLKTGVFLGNLHVVTDAGARSLQQYPLELIAL